MRLEDKFYCTPFSSMQLKWNISNYISIVLISLSVVSSSMHWKLFQYIEITLSLRILGTEFDGIWREFKALKNLLCNLTHSKNFFSWTFKSLKKKVLSFCGKTYCSGDNFSSCLTASHDTKTQSSITHSSFTQFSQSFVTISWAIERCWGRT